MHTLAVVTAPSRIVIVLHDSITVLRDKAGVEMFSEAADSTQKEVLQALRREGGELTYSELVLTTQLPYNVVTSAVKQLEKKKTVKTTEETVADIELVQLS